ncbi:HAD family hydrolase [Roseovarius sp. EL26]|uniref:HAD family hydrolase n=1 Tax=Roseovarius sp. EL26 TaxID=2126672 RepID=UPI001C1F5AA7|nr:HAD-IA family hydrolase [Roseovarius sp. EL26]
MESILRTCLMLDVDGVLVSGRPTDGLRWTFSLREDLGIDPTELIETFFSASWNDVVTGKQNLLPALSSSLSKIPTNVTAEELVSYWFKMDSRVMNAVLADCRLARTNGLSVYLATNQEHKRAQYLMDTLGLRSEVDGIIYSAQVGVQKPHADFYTYAEKAAGCDAKELLLVDDTHENIDGARKAGWDAVHWRNGMKLADILKPSISH